MLGRLAMNSGHSHLAYYYCKKAEGLYAKLSPVLRADPLTKAGEAAVNNILGITLLLRKGTFTEEFAKYWCCEGETIVKDTKPAKGFITKRTILKSPYSQNALRYFERAKILSPENLTINCNHAGTAYDLGIPEPMNNLENDADAHFLLGREYSNKAKKESNEEYPDHDLAAQYYALALTEYERAEKLNPGHLSALNSYAYTFWVWRLNSPHHSKAPNFDIAQKAERYARQVVNLAKGKVSQNDELRARSTLGEVLLARMRPEEAIEVFKEVCDLAPEHAIYDEMRWDLAQAYLCAASNAEKEHYLSKLGIGALRKNAIPYLIKIWQNDQNREDKLFPETPDEMPNRPSRLDPFQSCGVCRRDPESSIEPKPTQRRYVLRKDQPIYTCYPHCNWLGVVASVKPLKNSIRLKNLFLHVWGNGVDRVICVVHEKEEPEDRIWLSYQPKETYNHYFAQLVQHTRSGDKLYFIIDSRSRRMRTKLGSREVPPEIGEDGPVSDVYPIRTYADNSKNYIRLVFDQLR